jgi:hypothetical protein
MEFAYPGVGILAGDSIQYLSIATAHGVIMVFFMIMPAIFGAFGNFLLPTQLGVHDVAFPRLNSAAFWFLPGGLIMLCQLVCVDRRYQRMNCFNIRELQGILKRKFFTDLVNTSDNHKIMESTLVNMRHKNNMSNILLYDQSLFYNFDLTTTSKSKNYFFSPGKVFTYKSINLFKESYIYNFFPKTLNYTNTLTFLIKDVLNLLFVPTTTTLTSLLPSFFYLQTALLNTFYINLIPNFFQKYNFFFNTNSTPGLNQVNTTNNNTLYNSSYINYLTFEKLNSYSFSENSSS